VSQNTFLTLLITQLKNQDPMSPQDSSEFVAQLAQFSSLEQITQLNKNITAVLESSVTNLIGRTVEVLDSSSQTGLTQGVVTGITYYKDGPAIKVNGQDYPMKAVQSVS
jgi:flagellar basal-body rod modification protein FlgD